MPNKSDTSLNEILDALTLDDNQKSRVIELFEREYPAITLGRVEKIAQSVLDGVEFCVAQVNHGTDWGIFRASLEDIEAGWAMSHDEAIGLCRMEHPNSRFFDFGDTFYNPDNEDEGDNED
jgi:hypothetical protein